MRRAAIIATAAAALALAGTGATYALDAGHQADSRTPYPGMTKTQLRQNLLIADCLIRQVYEDGSATTRDAEQAVRCMRDAHVYRFFIQRFSP